MTGKRFITRRRLLVGGGLAGLVASYPFFIERYLVLVNTYRIPVPHLPAPFAGFRIVQLSDLHYGFLVPQAMIRRVVARANAAAGDVIVCTGDYVHARNTTEEIDRVWPLLAGLSAPDGVFSVLGNHDHWAHTERSQYWLERTGQDLRHRVVPIRRGKETVWLAGTGDLWEDRRDLDALLEPIPPADCRIVLAHNPDSADGRHRQRVDLMVSGHTHGGQVRLPFLGAPILPVRNKAYGAGLVRNGKGEPLFVSRGIGWAILPVRLNCPPEIAILELVPA